MTAGVISSQEISHDLEIDTLGLLCPIPIIRAADKIKSMEEGQVLKIVSDDSGVESDFPAWCLSHRHDFLGILKQGQEYHVFIKKGPGR